MILDESGAEYAANFIIDYFANFGRIDEYFRQIKIERMSIFPTALPGIGMRDYVFNQFDMHPDDMKISIRENDMLYDDLLDLTASHVVERSVPGRTIKLTVYETTTQTVIGFIRLGSCVINSKPRNLWLEKPLETINMEAMTRFNNGSVMGHIIVPTQPFGYNYLGGKLLAGICCSHEIKDIFDKKYSSNLCHFETTSLYGSSKASSQYDGMKPLLRFKGLTDSDFTPLMTDDKFKTLKNFFKRANDGKDLIEKATSLKMKTQGAMISIIKNSLKEHKKYDLLERFNVMLIKSKSMNEQKRVFISNYGYENSREYILGQTDTLIKSQTYDRHSMENVISWWKKLSCKRYDKLNSEGRIRRELELWNENTDIDIIR